MTASLGVLLISGRLTHQENYALQFANDPRCRLIGLSDEADVPVEREALNRALADDLAIPYLPDLADALGREDVDLVSVCAEPERRGRIVARGAAAGKHVYIDKPMTPYLMAADAAVQAVEAAGVRSQMFSFIHQPWVRRARQIVDSGELGELVAIHADCLFAKGSADRATLGQPRQVTYPPRNFTFVDAKAELYALGVYALGSVCWVTQQTVQTVYGCMANYFFAAHQKQDVEDFGFLLLQLSGGISATVTGGRIGWTKHGSEGTNQLYLIGSKKSLLVDVYRPRLEIFDAAPPWLPPPVNPRDPMGFWRSTQAEVGTQPKRTFVPLPVDEGRSDESHFIDCIIEGRESEMNVHQAAHLTEVLLAGYQSAATGTPVSLPLSRQ